MGGASKRMLQLSPLQGCTFTGRRFWAADFKQFHAAGNVAPRARPRPWGCTVMGQVGQPTPTRPRRPCRRFASGAQEEHELLFSRQPLSELIVGHTLFGPSALGGMCAGFLFL